MELLSKIDLLENFEWGCKIMSYIISCHSVSLSYIYVNPSEPIGLDWNKLKEKLNTDFDWETAVQRALGNEEAIEKVCFLIFVCILLLVFKYIN